MPQGPLVILNSGGLRSLVATAVALSPAEKQRVILVHFKDGRPTSPIRREHAHRQAEHFKIAHIVEVELPHLQSEVTSAPHVGPPPLTRPQILMIGVAQAIELHASRVIWPVQCNGDYGPIARLTEQVVLVQQIAQLEQTHVPSIESPLLELTDRQVIELGNQLDVPWPLSWGCDMTGDRPCRVCGGCKRRHAAFNAAGVVDPFEKPVAVR